MKTFRILTIIALGLMSLMNIGYPFSTEPKPAVALGVAVLVLGLAGLVAVTGVARRATWGLPAAIAVAAVNVVAALVALVNNSEGAAIGLTVSAIALASSLAAVAGRRRLSPA